MLFITHDLELASALCDRVLVMYAGRIMEQQPTAALFASPLHPYTAGLLEARPSIDARQERLTVIPGRPPTPVETPPGCPFHPRCAFVQDACLAGTSRRFAASSRTACRPACAPRQIRDELRPKTVRSHG